jgi:hypothetical protein
MEAGFGQKLPAIMNTSEQWFSNIKTGVQDFLVYFRFIKNGTIWQIM